MNVHNTSDDGEWWRACG